MRPVTGTALEIAVGGVYLPLLATLPVPGPMTLDEGVPQRERQSTTGSHNRYLFGNE